MVIKHRSRNQSIPVVQYGQLLRSWWDSYTPGLYYAIRSYELSVEDTEVREVILDLIRTELSEYVHNDRVKSAVFGIHGGSNNGFPLDRMLVQLLKVALVRGNQCAAYSFYECVVKERTSFQFMGLLNGVRVEQDLEISEGIRLVPLPKSTSELPSHLAQSNSFLRDVDLLGRTLIVIDMSISPIFGNPKLKPRWDVHLRGVGNWAVCCGGDLRPWIVGRSGSAS